MGDTPDSRGYGNSGDHNFVSDPRRESLFGSLNNPPLKQSQQDNDMGRGNSQERPIVIPDLYESIQQPPQKRRRAAPPNLITGDAPDSETDYPAHPRHTTQSSIGQLREAENDNEHREATQMKTPKVSDTAAVGSNGAALCVEKIIGIFPNISRRFVENLYISRRAGAGELHGMGELEFVQRIVDSILSKPSYPKEEKASKRRRQDGDEDVNGQWVDEGATHGRFYAPEA